MLNPQKNNKYNKSEMPLAYKFGGAFFCELPFYVTRDVLIPRFDTEKLVEAVITKGNGRVLELCTGSGCVAVVLAKHGFDVVASDISSRALKVAMKNAKLHDVNIDFIKSDLFQNITGKFDCIIANPPYIMTDELGKFDKSTLFEPLIALDGGNDGLCFYKRIIERAGEFLNEKGMIFFEMDYRQGKDISKLLENNGFCDIKIINDASGLERVIYARRK